MSPIFWPFAGFAGVVAPVTHQVKKKEHIQRSYRYYVEDNRAPPTRAAAVLRKVGPDGSILVETGDGTGDAVGTLYAWTPMGMLVESPTGATWHGGTLAIDCSDGTSYSLPFRPSACADCFPLASDKPASLTDDDPSFLLEEDFPAVKNAVRFQLMAWMGVAWPTTAIGISIEQSLRVARSIRSELLYVAVELERPRRDESKLSPSARVVLRARDAGRTAWGWRTMARVARHLADELMMTIAALDDARP